MDVGADPGMVSMEKLFLFEGEFQVFPLGTHPRIHFTSGGPLQMLDFHQGVGQQLLPHRSYNPSSNTSLIARQISALRKQAY